MAEPARSDEEFLDEVYELALERSIEGESVSPEELAAGREHLVEEIRELVALARSVVGRPVAPRPIVPGYHLEREFGRGAMGVVWLAH